MQRGGAFMRKRSRLVSVAFSHLALVIGVCTLPTVGQSTTYPMLDWTPPIDFTNGNPASFPPGTTATSLITTGTVPMWPGSDTFNNVQYNFSMVGKDPSLKSGNTVVTVKIIPIKFTSASPAMVFDPESNDACSPSRTPALNMVQSSPVFFKNGTLPGNLSSLGAGQFVSLFQRANFSTFTAKGGLSPNYKVELNQSLQNTGEKKSNWVAIEGLGGSVSTDPTWCAPVATIEVNQWDSYLRNTFFPALPRTSGPGDLLIFLFTNVAMYDSTQPPGQQCCILSYHGAFPSQLGGAPNGQLQTYIVANYDSTNGKNFPGAFPTAPDLVAIANAVAGWMDNPTTLNPTPNWLGTINGSTGCQDVLEVAFPPGLAGALTTLTIHNKIYHVQDLAFKSWFYQDTGSANTGFGGNYSLFGTFTSPAPTCP
jgi:hypothetical protein